MQDVRRKKPIKYNKDGSVSLDGSGVKILRLLEPQGEPDVIECDGMRYVPERTTKRVNSKDAFGITDCGEEYDACFLCARKLYIEDEFCSGCGAKVVE